jgi:hypothetical protein
MIFFVEYYSSPFIPRKTEIDQTLQHNISLNFLKKIFILTNNQNIDECKKIEFEKDIESEIKNINIKKSFYSNIILEKKVD